MPLMISTTEAPSRIQGFHGGSEVQWKGLGAPDVMFGAWDAIECAIFPPGAMAGLHAHNHTEEMWLVVAGRGVVRLGDWEQEVGPGNVILSSFDAVHSSRQVGEEPYFVIAILAQVVPPRTRNIEKGMGRGGTYHVVGLGYGSANGSADSLGVDGPAWVSSVAGTDLRRVLKAPWRTISHVTLEPGSRISSRKLIDSEVFLFTTDGNGTFHSDSGGIALTPKMALTVFMDTDLHVEAGSEPLSFFMVELGVEGLTMTGETKSNS